MDKISIRLDVDKVPLSLDIAIPCGLIITELVSNALKYTEKGSVSVDVNNGDSEVKITVTDTGVGIPEKDREKMFDKFSRGLATAHKTKGTGLGLFIVKSFLEIQNGSVKILSNPAGHGTLLVISLPKNKANLKSPQ